MLFNSAKSSILLFRCNLLRHNAHCGVSMRKEDIPLHETYKYLGNIISADLRDDQDIARQCKKVYAQGNTIIRKFGMCSEAVKTTLFKAYCTPLYTAHLWWNHTKSDINKLYVAYNNIFRILCHEPKRCSASLMFVTRGLPTCQMLIRTYVYSFIRRIKATSNTLIKHMVTNSDTRFRSNIWRHWCKMLSTNNQVFSSSTVTTVGT